MARKTRLVTWNGKDLPPEFCDLPAGRYIVELADKDAPAPSLDQEAGIEAALSHIVRAASLPPRAPARSLMQPSRLELDTLVMLTDRS